MSSKSFKLPLCLGLFYDTHAVHSTILWSRYAKRFLGEDLRLGFIGLWVADGECLLREMILTRAPCRNKCAINGATNRSELMGVNYRYDSTWHRDTSGVLGTNHREDCRYTSNLLLLVVDSLILTVCIRR